MDKRTAQIIAQMIMASVQEGPSAAYMGAGGGGIFGQNEFSGIVPEQDSFFGPIGTMIANMVPMLSTTGLDGTRTPIFKTNFRMQNSGMTGLGNIYALQNQKAFASAKAVQDVGMANAWASLVNGMDASGAANKPPPPEMQGFVASMRRILGSSTVGQFAQPLTNQLLGYDRGAAATVAMRESPFVAASLVNRSLGGLRHVGDWTDEEGIERSPNGVTHGRQMTTALDPFSEGFGNFRAATAANINEISDSLLWRGAIKNPAMHGMTSEALTGLVSEWMADGTLDRLMGEEGASARLAQARMDRTPKYEADLKKMEELQAKYNEAVANGGENSKEAVGIENELLLVKMNVEKFREDMDKITKDVTEAARPLAESVSGAVTSLQDFYGDFNESRAALDRLTGGRGSRDKDTADWVASEARHLQWLGARIGMDPRSAGAIWEGNRQALGAMAGSTLASGSLAHGAISAAFSEDLLNQLAGAQVSGWSKDKMSAAAQAHQAGVAAFGGSRAYKAQVALMAAIMDDSRVAGDAEGRKTFDPVLDENGKVINENATGAKYKRIMDLMQTGRSEDLEEALDQLGILMGGDKDYTRRFIGNPQNVASAAASLDKHPELAQLLKTIGINARHNEDTSNMRRGRWAARETAQAYALEESGYSGSDVSSMGNQAAYDAAMDFLGETAGSGGDKALTALQAEYEEALRELGQEGEDESSPEVQQRAKELAWRNFNDKGYRDALLSRDGNDALSDAVHRGIQDRYGRAMLFDQSKDKAVGANGTLSVGADSFLAQIGAADESGATRSSMGAAGKYLVEALRMMGGSARTANGERIGAEELDAFEKEYNRLLESGKASAANRYLEAFVGSFNDNTRNFTTGRLGSKEYNTLSNIEAKDSDERIIDQIMADEETAKLMGNMTEDEKREYIDLAKQSTGDLSEEERKEADERMKKLLEDAAKKSASDAENVVGAIQERDWEKLATVFKNANVSMEDFIKAIRKVIALVGGVTASNSELAAIKGMSSKEQSDLLGDLSMDKESRFALSGEGLSGYLELISGHEVGDKDVAEYSALLDAARGGGSGEYQRLLEKERRMMITQRTAMQSTARKKIKEAGGEIGSNVSSEELRAQLEGETDPGKKEELQKKIAAAEAAEDAIARGRALDSAIGAIDAQLSGIKGGGGGGSGGPSWLHTATPVAGGSPYGGGSQTVSVKVAGLEDLVSEMRTFINLEKGKAQFGNSSVT